MQKLKKLQQSLHLIGVQPAERKHTVFVDSAAEAKAFRQADRAPETGLCVARTGP